MKCVRKGPINNEAMMVSLLAHICLNRRQWVNDAPQHMSFDWVLMVLYAYMYVTHVHFATL